MLLLQVPKTQVFATRGGYFGYSFCHYIKYFFFSERAKRDVSTIKDMEWNLWNTGKVADPKSPVGGSYAFSKPKPQSVEISNSSFVLQFASRRFLDQLLGGEDNARANRQLKDAEFGNKDIGNYNLIWFNQ